jgi:hypothetical protein
VQRGINFPGALERGGNPGSIQGMELMGMTERRAEVVQEQAQADDILAVVA